MIKFTLRGKKNNLRKIKAAKIGTWQQQKVVTKIKLKLREKTKESSLRKIKIKLQPARPGPKKGLPQKLLKSSVLDKKIIAGEASAEPGLVFDFGQRKLSIHDAYEDLHLSLAKHLWCLSRPSGIFGCASMMLYHLKSLRLSTYDAYQDSQESFAKH